jgi:hypothetical protein
MQRTKYLIGFVFILFITNCKKDNNTETCINTEQRNAILQNLEHFKNDTTQYSAVERQFLNEVRELLMI